MSVTADEVTLAALDCELDPTGRAPATVAARRLLVAAQLGFHDIADIYAAALVTLTQNRSTP